MSQPNQSELFKRFVETDNEDEKQRIAQQLVNGQPYSSNAITNNGGNPWVENVYNPYQESQTHTIQTGTTQASVKPPTIGQAQPVQVSNLNDLLQTVLQPKPEQPKKKSIFEKFFG
ncbi:hypothetical protein FACS1894132_02370 [Clostridia bacterium]|nr:hypothetical protein FACS1894132_02370 [Clostridia bacterium]